MPSPLQLSTELERALACIDRTSNDVALPGKTRWQLLLCRDAIVNVLRKVDELPTTFRPGEPPRRRGNGAPHPAGLG
ncbi:conserved protein of unknown function [Rhodovastum atsumiense]|uniref:Uncharacterized protein n=1 Tax=Rhodovastum atsumiense TaxID=504468 RepID=A0A5M6J0Q2_9PROT|nr:hypothetical protein [Rhodovastum atsumiense]KAA5613779.1 hypothetical protein F1189_03105 [Rhodovastum atsumiense]CAH2601867.1 conserved protein of unknown function [Rhodovastum atsumiense]